MRNFKKNFWDQGKILDVLVFWLSKSEMQTALLPFKHNKSSQKPMTRKFFQDIFSSKMFMAKDTVAGNWKYVLSMSPLDKSTPSIPSLCILRKPGEMMTCTSAMCIIGSFIAAKSCTKLSSSFVRGEWFKLSLISLKTWETKSN